MIKMGRRRDRGRGRYPQERAEGEGKQIKSSQGPTHWTRRKEQQQKKQQRNRRRSRGAEGRDCWRQRLALDGLQDQVVEDQLVAKPTQTRGRVRVTR
jgi:hypothetical protein